MGYQMSKAQDSGKERGPEEVKALTRQEMNSENPPTVTTHSNKDETLFQSSVARLSLCEDEESRARIRNSLQRTESDDIIVDETSSNAQKAGNKRRRRRSSALGGPAVGKLKKTPEDLPSNLSIAVPKKKKKSTHPALLTVGQKALQKRISMKDIRDVVLYILQDSNNAPGWIQVENRGSIKKVVVLFVPGLQAEDFEENKKHSKRDNTGNPRATALISLENEELLDGVYRIPVSAPGSKSTLYSAYNSFINVGLSKKEKEERKEELSKKAITLNDLLLSTDQLLENEYPIHEKTPGLTPEDSEVILQKQSDDSSIWKSTQPFEHDGSHTFAMDCEMCMSDNGLVLARVSLVDFECNLVYDSLVKPDVPIVDYLTRYSGITEEKLRDVTTSLEDVQSHILSIVSSNDILIGHSLQSDLNVLKLRHPRIIDTAVIFEHKAGPPFRPALKYLAMEYLSQKIQDSDALGHDSFEDARACMELTKLKIVNGVAFGIGINTENLFHRLARNGVKSLCLNDYAPKESSLLSKRNASDVNVRCSSDEEIFQKIGANMDNYNLFVGRLRELEFAREYAVPPEGVSKKDAITARSNFVQMFEDLYCKCPASTVFIVCSGTGDTRDWAKIMGELNKMNRDEKFDERKKREGEIHEAVRKARDAIALITTKQTEPENAR